MADFALVALDESTRRHLAAAIRVYKDRLRVDGIWRLPGGLESLANALSEDWGGLEGTDEQTSVPVGDAGPMLYTFNEAATRLGVSPKTVGRLVSSGALPAVSIGRARRVHRDDLAEYAQRLRKVG